LKSTISNPTLVRDVEIVRAKKEEEVAIDIIKEGS
jgi:hypothetical protein